MTPELGPLFRAAVPTFAPDAPQFAQRVAEAEEEVGVPGGKRGRCEQSDDEPK